METSPKLQYVPASRLVMTMPWQIWALGWLAMIKACLWVFVTDTHHPALLVKYLVLAAPFYLMAVGIWNLRKWALRGLAVLCALDLLLHLVIPDALFMIDVGPTGRRQVIYATVVAMISGPVADVGALLLLPFARRVMGRWDLLKTEDN